MKELKKSFSPLDFRQPVAVNRKVWITLLDLPIFVLGRTLVKKLGQPMPVL